MMIEINKEDIKIGDFVILGSSYESLKPETAEVLKSCGLFKIKSIDLNTWDSPRVYIDPTTEQINKMRVAALDPYGNRFLSRIEKAFREIEEDIILI